MQNFAEMSSIGKQHESVSVRFSRVALSYKLAQDMNLTRRENTSQHTNLLKEFQECITDQEAYPTAELTCSEYGMPRIRVSNNFSITIFRVYLYSYIFKACGRRNTVYGNVRAKTRIVGGVESAPGDWPFLAALLGGPEQIFYCAGVLIADQWVLTASHCVGK